MADKKTKKIGTNTKGPEKKEDEIMDRATLKEIAANVQVKVLKSDSDADLQRKINDAIQKLPSGTVLKQLESIDPVKLTTVLKRDCIGIFVDFSDISCIRCADAKQCVRQFVDNLRDGMSAVKGAAAADEAEVEPKPSSQSKLTPVTRYDPKRAMWVRDVKNPNPKTDDYYDMIQRVLDTQPETLGQLRTIVEQEFDLDGDGDFMKFVTALRDPKEGVIKLDCDLSEQDKNALRKAGYDV